MEDSTPFLEINWKGIKLKEINTIENFPILKKYVFKV